MSIFTKTNENVNQPKRNTFDLSFQNNLTTKFGQLTPCFCKEVIPGDSFSIDPTFALRFQPMYFPVQTRMKASLHFFYVRNRNLWSDWKDFIGKTKDDLVPPYLSFKNSDHLSSTLSTSSLGDYLGVPTTVVGEYGDDTGKSFSGGFPFNILSSAINADEATMFGAKLTDVYSQQTNRSSENPQRYFGWSTTSGKLDITNGIPQVLYNYNNSIINSTTKTLEFKPRSSVFTLQAYDSANVSNTLHLYARVYAWYINPVADRTTAFNVLLGYKDILIFDVTKTTNGDVGLLKFTAKTLTDAQKSLDDWDNTPVAADASTYVETIIEQGRFAAGTYSPNAFTLSYVTKYGSAETFSNSLPSLNLCLADWDKGIPHTYTSENLADFSVTYSLSSANGVGEYSTVSFNNNLFENGTIKLSALPFRAYESIYNCFYRDSRNNPRMVNGVPEYNVYLPSTDGGADINEYTLHYRNWEQDFLTTAVQSPQQGIAPLVGVNAAGVFTFEDSDGNQYTAKATIGDDGHTLTGIDVHSPDMPQGSLRALVDAISYGISINDFRNVNSMQRWLEANVRKGFRYVDQIAAHFGVNVGYAELDMPEFIGGTTIDVSVNQVNSTAETESQKLGHYAGQAYAVGQSNHRISHYFDEHGFVIGILCVYPVPNYSQLLPKYFIKDNALDYFFPEFGHIGMQPITYKEVTPIQSYIAGDSLDDVFGYQRAWYDYLASTDEVHGDFRSSLRDYLINRVYYSRPELGSEFLTIDPTEVNNIFNYEGDDDKILGQIYFNVQAKRPIPMFGIPRLE